jgi:hypothetical protein
VRRLAVIVLSLVGLACLAVVQTMAHAGGNLLYPDRFADVVTSALRTDAGADALARVVVDDVSARAESAGVPLPASVQLQVGAVVAGLARAGAFGPPLRPAVVRAHGAVLDGDERIEIPLGAARPAVAGAVGRVAPGAAGLVPPADAFPVLAVPLGPRAQRAGALLDDVRDLTRWAPPLAVACLGLALLIAPRRDRLLRRLAFATLALALLPLLVRGALRVSASAVAPRDRDLATAVAEALSDGWARASLLTAALAAGMLVASAALGRR